ncbi:MAG: hypothetical protein IJL17_22960, partial [Kiritimatiellae bacterium]|nr:hypothetical protein [Kiritimatiellia bacterium]
MQGIHGCAAAALALGAALAANGAIEITCDYPGGNVKVEKIDEVLSGSKEGEWIRDNADCVFVPFMDKDGVENGDQGKHRAPHDHNR